VKPLRRTRLWRLPDGKTVLVWAKDVDALRADIVATGNVCLFRDPGATVYERIDPADAQAVSPLARRIG
jgi:hypothetical protein